MSTSPITLRSGRRLLPLPAAVAAAGPATPVPAAGPVATDCWLATYHASPRDSGSRSLCVTPAPVLSEVAQRARAVREMQARADAQGLLCGSNISPPSWYTPSADHPGRPRMWKRDWVDGAIIRPRGMMDDLVEGWGEARRRAWVEAERVKLGMEKNEDSEGEEDVEVKVEEDVKVKVEEEEDVKVKVEREEGVKVKVETEGMEDVVVKEEEDVWVKEEEEE